MKHIPGFENQYSIDENGRIWSYRLNRYLSASKNTAGYLVVGLNDEHKMRNYYVHRLVAAAYLGLDLNDSYTQVDHIDEDKSNPKLLNLRLATNKENMRYLHRCEDKILSDFKICADCKESKPKSSFYKCSRFSDGLGIYCKLCVKLRDRRGKNGKNNSL